MFNFKFLFMRKFFMIMAAVAAMFVNAQTFEQSKFIDNTYVRIDGGVTALTHPGCLGYENFGHSIQGVIGVEIGKWITPKFGVAFEGDFGIRNGSKLGLFQYESIDKKSQNFNYMTVTGLVKGNLSNIFGGYKSRTVEFVLATGPMWIHGFPGKNYENDFGVKFQGEVNVNVTDRVQINFIPELNYNLTGLYSYGTNEHPRFDSRNSWWGLKVGATYKIGKQFTACPFQYTQADVDKLNAEINDLRARQPEVVEKVIEKVVVKSADIPYAIVMFDKNSAELTNDAKAMLDGIQGSVEIVGSASPEGTKVRNDELANERANVVANYLKNRGVNVTSINGNATIGSRVAIIK